MLGGNQFGLGPLEAHQVCSAPDAHDDCADWVAGVTPGAAERSGAAVIGMPAGRWGVRAVLRVLCLPCAVTVGCDGCAGVVRRAHATSLTDRPDLLQIAGVHPRSSSLDPATAHPISMDPPPLVSLDPATAGLSSLDPATAHPSNLDPPAAHPSWTLPPLIRAATRADPAPADPSNLDPRALASTLDPPTADPSSMDPAPADPRSSPFSCGTSVRAY
jgi:hypothetical protein